MTTKRQEHRLLLMIAVLQMAATANARAESPPVATPTVQVVDSVALDRYVGVWHEVAKIPNRFQKQCARGTTATYTLRPDGRITVLNACFKENGSRSQAEGVARIVDRSNNARLEVSFVSFLGWRPFWGDYWILGLDPDYRWAVIGTPDRKYGWILARSETLAETELDLAFAVLAGNGYRREEFELSLP